MPLIDRSQAKESGFAQVREALQKFEGTVASAEFGLWGGVLIDEDGKPLPPKEFLEVVNTNVEVLEVTEELSMPIDEWTFRVNCSDYKGSFWVDKFLESADKAKILIPDDLVGKRIVWVKASMTFNIKKREITQTNFVIGSVKGKAKAAPKVVAKVEVIDEAVIAAVEVPDKSALGDPMVVALELAVGKTEAQFRTAISLDPRFVGSPLLPMAKAGVITQSLLNEGKLVLVDTKYQKPE